MYKPVLHRLCRSCLLYAALVLPALPAVARTALPYPDHSPLSADEIAVQAHGAARGGLVRNAISRETNGAVALLVNRAPLDKRQPGRKPSVNLFETYVNNRPQDPAIDSLQMAVITSGQVKGTGVLFTSYTDQSREPRISLWLPALRKIRSMNAPAHEDTWAGSNLTYGELVLRRPEHETHELLGEAVFDECLPVMELQDWEQVRYTQNLPPPQCGHRGRPVYTLKSTTKFRNWWYDYHVSEIDKESFSLYRTRYYKGDTLIKTVVVDWQPLGMPDPRITYPRYVYALSHDDGRDSMIFVPRRPSN